MNLLIASNNEHKIKEIKAILGGKFENIYSLKEQNIDCDPEENGETFFANALIKAKAISKLTNMPVLSDDTGLCVDALNGAPGVHSARYAGNHDHAENRKKLLKELNGKSNRNAHFETCVILLMPDGRMFSAMGRVDGKILEQEQGEHGFGYDPLFYCNDLGKCFGIATEEEKNAYSHRARALQNLLSILSH